MEKLGKEFNRLVSYTDSIDGLMRKRNLIHKKEQKKQINQTRKKADTYTV